MEPTVLKIAMAIVFLIRLPLANTGFSGRRSWGICRMCCDNGLSSRYDMLRNCTRCFLFALHIESGIVMCKGGAKNCYQEV